MRILVTGGLGFIGSNFIQYWFGKHPKDSITNLDKVTYAANFENVSGIEDKYAYAFVKGDICDSQLVERLVRDSDAVINFAAETHVDNSIAESGAFVRSNILGVHALLNAVKAHETRFHQVSTDEVYGSLSLGSKDKFTETSRYAPRNPYSASKASADHLVNAYFNTYKLPVTISNSSNNYGRGQHREKLIPKTILNAVQDKKIPLYGNGMQVRDWLYVEDHCSALESILEKGAYGETYLVSSNNEMHNIDVVRKILKLLGKSENLIEFVVDRQGHDERYALDASKISGMLGWKPFVAFDDGLALTVSEYANNLEKYTQNK